MTTANCIDQTKGDTSQDFKLKKEIEKHFDHFFNLSLDILCISSVDGHFKYVNPAFTRILGWSAEELTTRPFLFFVHPDDQIATAREVERQVVAGEKVLQFENRYRHKNGTWRVLSWRSVPEVERGLMYATARDVTEQRDTEEAISRLNADLQHQVQERTAALDALHTKEEEIRAVLDNLLDCVITFDCWGIVHSANPAVSQILGYTPGEIAGRDISSLINGYSSGNQNAYVDHVELVTDAHLIGAGREVEGVHKDGRVIPLELAVNEYVIRGERQFIGTLRDIRERKRFIAELTEARAEAEQANRAKSAFLAAMSHEIRTPMNGVIGMVDVLSHSPLTEQQNELVRTMRESGTSLLGIIDDILDFSKIEAGRLEIERAPVGVADLLESLCNSLLPVASRRNVKLRLFVSPEIPERVLSDDVRLRQVLYNLVGNAIKFSSGRQGTRGDVSVRVEVAQANPLQLLFRINDNGVGIRPETQKILFTPFTQAEVSTTRRYGGTGLGLVIVKRLVDLMGGKIEIESAPGAGSTFSVTLPFEPAPEQPVTSQTNLSGINCILVKESGLTVDDFTVYLEHGGARVRTVHDAKAVTRAAAGLTGPVVVIQDLGHKKFPTHTDPDDLPNICNLYITWGKRRRARVGGSDFVSLDGNAMRRKTLLRAVGIAAGVASPEVFYQDTWEMDMNLKTPPPTIAEARARGQLILVVDDDEINQKVVLQQLWLLGYAAEVAWNGEEALRMWRQGDYALLLTDLHMPRMDGYSLTGQIRQEEGKHRRIPILALTANALRGEASHARAVGMDDYLTKPVQLHLLKDALKKWIPLQDRAAPLPSLDKGLKSDHGSSEVDVTVLKGLVGDDMAVVNGLLSEFQLSAGRLADEIRAAYTGQDQHKLSTAAHKLKSASRSVGALSLGDLCEQLENAGREEDKAMVDARIKQFEKIFNAVKAEITALLATQAGLRT